MSDGPATSAISSINRSQEWILVDKQGDIGFLCWRGLRGSLACPLQAMPCVQGHGFALNLPLIARPSNMRIPLDATRVQTSKKIAHAQNLDGRFVRNARVLQNGVGNYQIRGSRRSRSKCCRMQKHANERKRAQTPLCKRAQTQVRKRRQKKKKTASEKERKCKSAKDGRKKEKERFCLKIANNHVEITRFGNSHKNQRI